ncbi:MAG: FtsX-like permease family protein [Thermoleophilia bacterium]|nr:FtsX-like permease family protein [Thermoleophilia bacterium]
MFAWSTFRARWHLFLGAIVTTAFAVSFTQASLLALVAAATASVPPELPEPTRLALDDGYAAAITVLSMGVGVAFFVSVFVVASTFSFAVAQRRTDFALLRLLGASRGQVQRLLLSESLLLGVVATVLGVPLGVGVAAVQDRMLADFGFVPAGFRTQWRGWAIAVSAGVGIGVAHLSARVAARRASRVLPLESLRGSVATDRVMTAARWVIGSLGIAGATAMVSVASLVGPDAAAALAINTCLVLVLALSAWSPLVIPAFAALVARVSRHGPLSELVSANLRTAVRRTAATAAPITVLCGLVVGVNGTFGTIAEATRHETRLINTSTIVAADAEPISPILADTPGIGCLSESIDVVAHVRAADFDDEPLVDTPIAALAVDPTPYLCTHRIADMRGDLARLSGATIGVDAGLAERMQIDVGDTTTISIAGRSLAAEVVAITSTNYGPLPELWLPIGLVDATVGPATGDHHVQLTTIDDDATSEVLSMLTAAGIDAQSTDEWVGTGATGGRQNRNIQVALVGMATLFALTAIANAVINASADRRDEFAALRLVGLTRRQVIATALWESAATLLTGLLLGVLAATGPILAVHRTVSRTIDAPATAWPWQALGFVTVSSAVLVTLATAITAIAVTHRPVRPGGQVSRVAPGPATRET